MPKNIKVKKKRCYQCHSNESLKRVTISHFFSNVIIICLVLIRKRCREYPKRLNPYRKFVRTIRFEANNLKSTYLIKGKNHQSNGVKWRQRISLPATLHTGNYLNKAKSQPWGRKSPFHPRNKIEDGLQRKSRRSSDHSRQRTPFSTGKKLKTNHLLR